MREPLPGAGALLLTLTLAPASLACGGGPEGALARGDRLQALGRTTEAVAEYKLAARRRGEDPEVLARLGAAYAGRGEVEQATRYYSRLLESDSSYRHQVAAELVSLAERSLRRGDRSRMVRALEPVADLGLRLVPPELRLALAEEYYARNVYGRALPLYLSVYRPPAADSADIPVESAGAPPDFPDAPPDSVGTGSGSAAVPSYSRPPELAVSLSDSARATELLYHVGRSYEELGACGEALPYFRAYLERRGRRPGADRSSAEWHYGTCLYSVAGRERRGGAAEAALAHLDRLVELGVPRTLIDRAHYYRGEVYMSRGDDQKALGEFQRVLRLNPARSGPLVQLAEQRIRELRYGRQ